MAMVLMVIVPLVCAFIAHVYAPRWGRNRRAWVVASLFTGPLALLILWALPKRVHSGSVVV